MHGNISASNLFLFFTGDAPTITATQPEMHYYFSIDGLNSVINVYL